MSGNNGDVRKQACVARAALDKEMQENAMQVERCNRAIAAHEMAIQKLHADREQAVLYGRELIGRASSLNMVLEMFEPGLSKVQHLMGEVVDLPNAGDGKPKLGFIDNRESGPAEPEPSTA